MPNATYRQAAHVAAAKLLPERIAVQTRALVARLQGLRRLNAGLGVMVLPPAVRRSVSNPGVPTHTAGYRAGLLSVAAVPGMARRQFLRSGIGAVAPTKPIGPALVGAGRQLAFAAVAPRLAGVVDRHGAGSKSAGVKPGLTARLSPALVASTTPLAERPRGIAAVTAAGTGSRVRHHMATAAPHQAVAPGFHRTVRQPLTKATAGNVYLDKTLVGYHLAAAITAEQTRAAARPNGSGASFNSSMAALRPTGAGL